MPGYGNYTMGAPGNIGIGRQRPLGWYQEGSTTPGQPAPQWQRPKKPKPPAGAPPVPQNAPQVFQQGMQFAQQPPGLAYPEVQQAPQLPAPMPLGMVAQTNVPFPQFPSYGVPYPSAPNQAPSPPSYGPASGMGQAFIQGGITPPSLPARPTQPRLPYRRATGQPAGMGSGMLAGYQQGVAPAAAGLEGEWWLGGADLANGYQNARAQSGLGWGGLAQNLRDLTRQQSASRQGNLVDLLSARWL